MKKFVLRTLVFLLLFVPLIYWTFSLADGYTDPFYIRFTTPRQNSLILGTSRAAQGLHPDVINKVLDSDIFNYAFTKAHSPFGPIYLNSIRKKIDQNAKNGLFIVTVDPWSISCKAADPNNPSTFREVGLFLDKTGLVNSNPNPGYLTYSFNNKYYKLVFPDSSPMFLHTNGWLEVTIDMDSASVAERTKRKLIDYKTKDLLVYKFSALRLDYLAKTIKFLRQHGDVYLVRLPMDQGMMEIENKLMPTFENKMLDIVHLASGYLDLTKHNTSFGYNDGNHLDKYSGKQVSKMIAEWIKGQKK